MEIIKTKIYRLFGIELFSIQEIVETVEKTTYKVPLEYYDLEFKGVDE